MELRNESEHNQMFLKISWMAGSLKQMMSWWQKTSGEKKNPGTVFKLTRQHLDGHNLLQATHVLKYQGWVKPAVQVVSHGNDMMHMRICTFYHVVSHEHVLKPDQTKPMLFWKASARTWGGRRWTSTCAPRQSPSSTAKFLFKKKVFRDIKCLCTEYFYT